MALMTPAISPPGLKGRAAELVEVWIIKTSGS
jgi:hypothetical protein